MNKLHFCTPNKHFINSLKGGPFKVDCIDYDCFLEIMSDDVFTIAASKLNAIVKSDRKYENEFVAVEVVGIKAGEKFYSEKMLSVAGEFFGLDIAKECELVSVVVFTTGDNTNIQSFENRLGVTWKNSNTVVYKGEVIKFMSNSRGLDVTPSGKSAKMLCDYYKITALDFDHIKNLISPTDFSILNGDGYLLDCVMKRMQQVVAEKENLGKMDELVLSEKISSSTDKCDIVFTKIVYILGFIYGIPVVTEKSESQEHSFECVVNYDDFSSKDIMSGCICLFCSIPDANDAISMLEYK